MPLETAQYIHQLDAANPLGSDPIAAGDDHLRLIKAAVKATFPNITGVVNVSHTDINDKVPNAVQKDGSVAMTGALTLPGNASSALQAVPFQQLQAMYPVGSIYMNATNNTNPASLFGFGTWVAFGAGRMPVGFNAADPLFDTAEETGGSKDAIVPSHTHTATSNSVVDTRLTSAGTYDRPSGAATGGRISVPVNGTSAKFYTSGGGSDFYHWGIDLENQQVTQTVSTTVASSGSSGTNANLPPYITVYMWKRTA